MKHRTRSAIAGSLLSSVAALGMVNSNEAAAVPPQHPEHTQSTTFSRVASYTARAIGCALMDRTGVETYGSSRGDVDYVEGPDRILGTADDQREAEVHAAAKQPRLAFEIAAGLPESGIAVQITGTAPYETPGLWDNNLSEQDVQTAATALLPEAINVRNGYQTVSLASVDGHYVVRNDFGEPQQLTDQQAREEMNDVAGKVTDMLGRAGVTQCVAPPAELAKIFAA